jgi:hypothetical protein
VCTLLASGSGYVTSDWQPGIEYLVFHHSVWHAGEKIWLAV